LPEGVSMKQPHTENFHDWSGYINIMNGGNPVVRTISVTVPSDIVKTVYQQAVMAQQKQAQPYGLRQKEAPLHYIEQVYQGHILDQVYEFLFKFFVVNILYDELHTKRILLAGTPRLVAVTADDYNNAVYKFSATVFPDMHITEWKYLPFKAPRRKRYKDLDKQVELFIAEEELNKENNARSCACVHDWINFDIMLADQDGHTLLDGYHENLWLKIGSEEADATYQELFLGRKIGDVIVTHNEALQDYFNEQTGSNFNFCVTIRDIIPDAYVCIDSLKKQFRIKTNKDLHQKLIEVFSYRNDISQRKTMVDEAFRLMLSKNAFNVPNFLILRQREELLHAVQSNPDYLVYKTQKDFKRSIEQLAERQVKETILMDAVAFNEHLEISHDDVKNYLNLTKRMRTREFIHFKMPSTKIRGQEEPIITQELMPYCLREKTLNYIIYHLTKK
jgi:FKBP-type peptidyl-prolyl cis-trans isomerase (trigger factor)